MTLPVKVIAFDAVGTLIYAMPSVSSAYGSVLSKTCGIEVDAGRVRSVLNARLSERIREHDLRTSEEREREFWFDLISELVHQQEQKKRAFDSLFSYFADPGHWRCFDDVEPVLTALRSDGFRLLLASNFDHRLHNVKQGLRELSVIEQTIVSSEVGWRKPAGQFFQHVCEVAQCEPHEVLFVGDDMSADVIGARSSGMHAAWLDRRSASDLPREDSRIFRCESLHQLIAIPVLAPYRRGIP
ncbi:MAG: HAD-IA family hydrolase [Planctomycetota bacterium]